MKFEWDKNKAKVNLQKHKISFSEASTIFGDPLECNRSDPLNPLDTIYYTDQKTIKFLKII